MLKTNLPLSFQDDYTKNPYLFDMLLAYVCYLTKTIYQVVFVINFIRKSFIKNDKIKLINIL